MEADPSQYLLDEMWEEIMCKCKLSVAGILARTCRRLEDFFKKRYIYKRSNDLKLKVVEKFNGFLTGAYDSVSAWHCMSEHMNLFICWEDVLMRQASEMDVYCDRLLNVRYTNESKHRLTLVHPSEVKGTKYMGNPRTDLSNGMIKHLERITGDRCFRQFYDSCDNNLLHSSKGKSYPTKMNPQPTIPITLPYQCSEAC